MKKIYSIVFLSLISVLLLSSAAQAYIDPDTKVREDWGPACNPTTHVDPLAGKGLVPCGQTTQCRSRIGFASFIVDCNLCQGISPTGTRSCVRVVTCPCELGHAFIMVNRIFNFAVLVVSIPLAAFMVVVGGLLILVSGGNPGLADKGKSILKSSVIALLLILGSWLIINTVLQLLGYPLVWSQF